MKLLEENKEPTVQELTEKAILDDVRDMCSRPSGRRLLMHLVQISGAYQSVFVPEKSETMNFLAGKQWMGLHLNEMIIKASPNLATSLYGEMVRGELSYSGRIENAKAKKDD